MKPEELLNKLEHANLPNIELKSQQNQLRAALLRRDSFNAIRGETTMTKVQGNQGAIDSYGRNFFRLHPVWKYVLGILVALALFYVTVFALPSLGPQKAGTIPDGGHTVITGPKLSPENEAKVRDILKANAKVQELLVNGAVIKSIMPIEVTLQQVDGETGATTTVTSTDSMAQVWLGQGEKEWGVVVDLVQSRVVSVSQ